MSFEAARGGAVGRHMSKRGGGDIDGWFVERRDSLTADPVSYTHLTLPTIYPV